jgi:hypothetical protein
MNQLLVSRIPLSYQGATRIHISLLGLRLSKRRQLPYEDEDGDRVIFFYLGESST